MSYFVFRSQILALSTAFCMTHFNIPANIKFISLRILYLKACKFYYGLQRGLSQSKHFFFF